MPIVGLPTVVGASRWSLRHRDRGVRDLGRAVEDVEHVAEDVERLGRGHAGKLRAAAEDDAKRRGVELARSAPDRARACAGASPGTTTAVVARCSWTPRRNSSASKRRRQTILQPNERAIERFAKPERVEERRRDVGHLAGPERHPVEQRPERVDRSDLAPRRALRRPGGAAGEHHDGRPHAAGVDRGRRRGRDQLLERRLGAARVARVRPAPGSGARPSRARGRRTPRRRRAPRPPRACRRRRSAARRTPCS